MISFHVNDMTCGHCVRAITQALRDVDAATRVGVDLAAHRVDIDPGSAGADALGAAIREAGYTPVAVEAPGAGMAAGAAPARKGCCCR